VPETNRSVIEHDFPGGAAAHAPDGFQQFGAAGSDQPGDADDPPSLSGEADV
jgi:hypothetical protein